MFGLEGKVCKEGTNDKGIAKKTFRVEVIFYMLRNCSECLVVAFADGCSVIWTQ